ncbi:hypothetical protein GCM10010178_91300 [Lentzea flava]|uniref:Uncharacterized protein n=1 Tax=Lentzea flava TaxID=103732 RepID=A0ABQ2VJH3_9PSEU|nr:hypothetical protein GCM10010178_91300 [Lentzea flava]
MGLTWHRWREQRCAEIGPPREGVRFGRAGQWRRLSHRSERADRRWRLGLPNRGEPGTQPARGELWHRRYNLPAQPERELHVQPIGDGQHSLRSRASEACMHTNTNYPGHS